MRGGLADVLGRVRTPAEPGPGPLTGGSLRTLDLVIGRRLSGLVSGDYRSPFAGLGSEFHQVRPYEPGDDVRRIDLQQTGEDVGLLVGKARLIQKLEELPAG